MQGLTNFIQRAAGYVGGVIKTIAPGRPIFWFNDDHFEIEDIDDVALNGTTADPGIAGKATKVSLRSGGAGNVPTTRTLATTAPLRIDGGASADLSANRTLTIVAASSLTPGTMSTADFDKLTAIAAGADLTLAGAGMTKTGSTLNVIAANDSITVNADSIELKAAYKTDLDGATSAATNSTLAKRGSSAEAAFGYVELGSGTKPNTGLVRAADGAAVLGLRTGGGTSFVGISWSSGDLEIGDQTSVTNAIIKSSTAGRIRVAGNTMIEATGTQIGVFGVTPAARASAYTQTYSTTTRTFSAYTPDDESASYSGLPDGEGGTPYADVNDLQDLRVAYENLRAHTEVMGKLLNAVIDDLQAYGWLQ